MKYRGYEYGNYGDLGGAGRVMPDQVPSIREQQVSDLLMVYLPAG